MRKNFKKGFTLIELLVVIAIIAILSVLVILAVNSAHNKGNDGAIKSNIDGARAQAELYYYANNNSYAGVCTGSAGTVKGVNSMLVGAASALGGGTTIGTGAFTYGSSDSATSVVCHDGPAGWAAIVSLHNPSTANAGWCIDSASSTSKEATILSFASAPGSLVCGQ